MSDEMFDKLGPALSAIGEQAAADLGGDPNGIYIYVEAGDGWYSDNLFRLEGEQIRFYSASDELGELIWELWNIGEPGKRWSVMEYEIKGDQFDVQFHYPRDVDVDDLDTDRRAEALKRRYGAKPVVYPARHETKGFQL